MQYTAKTVDEAIELGLKEENLTKEDAIITIIEQPVKGLFGILKGKAIVEITKKEQNIEQTNSEENVVQFVQGLLDMMEIKAEATLKEDEKNTTIVLTAEDSSALIGYRGEVLDAIQTIAGAVLNIGKKEYQKVVVDCENYREKREETLVKLAHKLEEKATEMRREVILEPMSPYERRIIHTALAQSQTVTTNSEGKEPNRYVVIIPNDKDEFSKPYNAGRNNADKSRHERRGGRNNGGRNNKRHGSGEGRRKQSSGFTQEKRKSTFSFGTYLGNSLKK